MNRRLSDQDFQREMAEAKKENAYIEKRLLLKAEKEKYKKGSRFETSKLIALYLFGILNTILVYSMVAMWHFGDLSYLGVLISDIAAQVMIYAIYCLKAYHAKKQSELMKFDREKLQGDLGNILDAGADSQEYVPLTNGNVDVFEAPEDSVG